MGVGAGAVGAPSLCGTESGQPHGPQILVSLRGTRLAPRASELGVRCLPALLPMTRHSGQLAGPSPAAGPTHGASGELQPSACGPRALGLSQAGERSGGQRRGSNVGGSMWGEQRGRLRGLVPSHSPPAPALETLVVDRPASLPHRQRCPEAAAGLDLVLDDRDPRGKKGGRRGPSTRGGGARLLAWRPKLRSRGRPASVPRPHKGDSPRRAGGPQEETQLTVLQTPRGSGYRTVLDAVRLEWGCLRR